MQIGMTRTLIGLLILAGVIFILNKVALVHFFYWRFWWYDVMMHFISGALIGALALWGALRFYPTLSKRKLFVMAILTAIVVGLGWEVMEYVGGITHSEAGYVFDTVKDLVMDTLGSLLVCSIFMLAARVMPPKEIV